MRVLLSKESKKRLLARLKEINNCQKLSELSRKIKVSRRTLERWFYDYSKYLPEKEIPLEMQKEIEVIDRKEDNWGRALGGKKAYLSIVKKYGLAEIRRRQSAGGKSASKKRKASEPIIVLDLENPKFLEFYGVLLGDGWMSKLNYKGKIINLIGISGNGKLDREFFIYLKENIKELFNRRAYLKKRPQYNSIELNFTNKGLVKAIHEELAFPIGEKIDLVISEKVYNLGYEKMAHVIRGIFDTDGSFYFDKTPANHPYPCINICMKAPRLIKQIYDLLIQRGFKVYYDKHRAPIEQIRLKGSIQVYKWMKEIGSSNPKHLNKIKTLPLWRNLDSAAAS